jgi:succinoglycan biosynthesis protein ExoA
MSQGEAMTTGTPLPLVTVGIPCLNEAGYVEGCLRSILAQDYPRDRLEIIVADGMSTDGTREILARLCEETPELRVVDNPGRVQAAGMNAVILQARGSVIVRMDAHCEYAPDYLLRCVEELDRTGADNVGGAQRIHARNPFEEAVRDALRSPLGAGGASYRSTENEGFVDTVFLGAFRRRVFDDVGLYDAGAITNEDAELNQRILAAGGKIYLSRAIVAYYYPRSTLRSLAGQYFWYGRGRARTMLKHRRLDRLRPVLPFLGVTASVALLVVPELHPVIPWAVGGYLTLAALEAFRVGKSCRLAGKARMLAIFPAMQVAHGVGFGLGLLRYGIRPDWEPTSGPPDPASGAPAQLSATSARD